MIALDRLFHLSNHPQIGIGGCCRCGWYAVFGVPAPLVAVGALIGNEVGKKKINPTLTQYVLSWLRLS
jgi:hypothetical protein